MALAERWLRRIVAVLTVVLPALLVWQCVDIYAEGEFTRDLVADRLRYFVLPAIIYALLAVVTAFLGKKRENIPEITPENRLRLLKSRAQKLPENALREEKRRRVIKISAAAAVLVCAAFCLAFLFDGRNFASWNMEKVMGALLIHTVPWIILAFGVMCGAEYMIKASIKRETTMLKPEKTAVKPAFSEKRAPVGAARVVILALAVGFIVAGIFNGGMRDVLIKAINICTECIGLG